MNYIKRLHYIDEHAITVPADPASTWAALLRVMCREPADPTTVPFGFVLDAATPPECFALKGRHWFSVYKLVFELTEDDRDGTRVAAQTWAAFPGVRGKIYRALVIGSGGHRIVVRRMLRNIAAQTKSHGIHTA